jgi:XRE family aerobic/anaerobic benzoate catabolism transcriptional regulator
MGATVSPNEWPGAIGPRLRALRQSHGLTRKKLAELAHMSPRWLAEIERGSANPSIARLSALAVVLGIAPRTLIEGDPVPHRTPEMTALRKGIDDVLDGRDLTELREVKRWLDARFAKRTAPVIALLGLRGAGKSTVGKLLAARLGLPFIELDSEIERAAGLSLAAIFELHGEGYYRRLERETLATLLASGGGMVLATGGSIVNDKETFKLLRRRASTVWLKARAEDHWDRVIVHQGDRRPARSRDAMAELRALLTARERLYGEAEHVLDTSRLSVDETVDTLAAELGGFAR